MSRPQSNSPRLRITTERFDKLVSQIYEAATDESLWPRALSEVVRFVGNSGTHLFLIDPVTRRVSQDAYFGMPELLMREYDTQNILQCPRVANANAHPQRALLFDYQHIDEKGIDHSEYYHWLQSKGDGIRYYLGGRLTLLFGVQGFISLAFRKKEGHSQPVHARRLLAVLPHINRSIQIGQQLGTSRLASLGQSQLLDRHGSAVIMLNSGNHVVYTNSAAEQLMRSAHWLKVSSDSLHLSDGVLDRRLQAAIAACRSIAMGSGVSPVRFVDVIACDGHRYRVAPAPVVDQSRAFGGCSAHVIVAITRLPAEASQPILKGCERLTPAEGRLAQKLVGGLTVSTAARELGVSVHTARTQLKQIYAKTNAHHLGELVALLWRSR